MSAPDLNGEMNTAINARAARLERRQNWHFMVLAIPVVLALLATAVSYGRLDGRVGGLEDAMVLMADHNDDMVERLRKTDIRQWDELNKIGPILTAIAADIAFIRGLHEAGEVPLRFFQRGSE